MKEKLNKAFRAFPLENTEKAEPESNVPRPCEEAVEEAKEWVDFKEM